MPALELNPALRVDVETPSIGFPALSANEIDLGAMSVRVSASQKSSVGLPRPPTDRLAMLRGGELRRHVSLSQPSSHVLVENARNERLIRHALLKCLDLNILKVARGKPDVHTAVLDCRCSRGGPKFRQFGLCCHRLQRAFFEGGDQIGFVGVSLWHLAHLGPGSLVLPCGWV